MLGSSALNVKGQVNSQKNSNFFFCAFILLMVCAKGIGLDSSDPIYVLMAIVSIPFWIIYVTQLRWNSVTLTYAITIFAIACITTIITRRTGVILTVMATVAMKDINREKLMKWILKLWTCCMAVVLIGVACGIISDRVVNENGKTWHGMGYLTGNLFSASAVILVILYVYYKKEKIKYVELFLLVLVNYIVYQYSASRSGFIVGITAVLLDGILKVIKKRRLLMKLTLLGLLIGIILVFSFSFILPLLYNGDWGSNSPVSVLNRALTGRIQHGKTVFLSDPITLFGNPNELSAFIDNSYVFSLMKYGVVVTIMLCIVYALAIKSMFQRKDVYGICVIFLFVIYGFTEQFFINSFMNYSFLLVGNEMINVVLRGPRQGCCLKERKHDVQFG